MSLIVCFFPAAITIFIVDRLLLLNLHARQSLGLSSRVLREQWYRVHAPFSFWCSCGARLPMSVGEPLVTIASGRLPVGDLPRLLFRMPFGPPAFWSACLSFRLRLSRAHASPILYFSSRRTRSRGPQGGPGSGVASLSSQAHASLLSFLSPKSFILSTIHYPHIRIRPIQLGVPGMSYSIFFLTVPLFLSLFPNLRCPISTQREVRCLSHVIGFQGVGFNPCPQT